MDVISRIIRWVELDNPVDFWNIETSGGDVCTQQDTGWGVAEFKECVCSFLLFLFTLPCVSAILSK